MSEPIPEHVEAVANLLHDAEHVDPECDCDAKGGGGPWGIDAEVILTSTNPAVLDAMQDALVRAGRLREQHSPYRDSDGHRRSETRLVTEWQGGA